jgi:RNA polymerase sigma factor (sigma-70 family)
VRLQVACIRKNLVPKKSLNGVLERIRALAAVRTRRAGSDRELLGRFVTAQDEAAFTTLVERHGPMVLGLCRRVLRHGQDAEDACQATFLVLARRAGSVRKQESLASWLHGVAFRIALNLKRQHARRQRREQIATRPTAHDSDGDDITWRELRAVLDAELQRLPERYRAPLVLCYLEGKTRDEAALQLGCRPGTLHGVLERARKLLRGRLEQRGLTLSSALLATALSTPPGQAALAAELVVISTRAALAWSRGAGLPENLIAPHILSLAKEASKAMIVTKLKIGAALLAVAGLLTAVSGGSWHSVSLAQDPAPSNPKAAAQKPAETDEDFIRRLSKDLRGVEPSPAEVHFFAANKDPQRRQKLIDLFIQERQAKAPAARDMLRIAELNLVLDEAILTTDRLEVLNVRPPRRYMAIFQDYYQAILSAPQQKKDVAGITQKYLDQLLEYVKSQPKNDDAAEAMLHISLVYRSQGKAVEADAWRDKLVKEHPDSSAAKTARQPATDGRIHVRFNLDSAPVPLEWQYSPRTKKDADAEKVQTPKKK